MLGDLCLFHGDLEAVQFRLLTEHLLFHVVDLLVVQTDVVLELLATRLEFTELRGDGALEEERFNDIVDREGDLGPSHLNPDHLINA